MGIGDIEAKVVWYIINTLFPQRKERASLIAVQLC